MTTLRPFASFAVSVCASLAMLASVPALAAPKVVGSAPELGAWNATASTAVLHDDGIAPDVAANDGIFTATVTFATAGTIDYKISRNGTDLNDGGLGTVNVAVNLKTSTAAANTPVTFYYDTRNLSAQGWAPGTESVGDSRSAAFKLGNTAQTWVIVGDFQAAIGDAANFNQASTLTVLRDDGKGGDRIAGDGVYSFRFKAPVAFTNAQWKVAAQGASWTTKLGSNGWSYDPDDSSNASFSANAGELVTFEFDALRGRLRSKVTSGAPAKLVVSEIVAAPNEYEYVELYNPGSSPIDLSDYYLSDFANSYELVKATPPTAPSNDFLVRFPAGATIQPGEYQTVSIYGAECFKNGNSNLTACPTSATTLPGLGVLPTYELVSTTTARNLPSVPDMVAPYASAVNAAKGLTNGGEPVILFYWDGVSDLVVDVDIVTFGAPTASNQPPNKTGIAVDGPDADSTASTYAADTPYNAANAIAVNSANNAYARADFTEGAQLSSGSNGIGGRDETSENWAQTWKKSDYAITPNQPTAVLVEVAPPSPAVELNGTLPLSAAAWGDLGKTQPLTTLPVSWATTPASPTKFSFDPTTATLTGVAIGTGEKVTAAIGGLGKDAQVTVKYHAISVACDKALLPNNGTANCTAQAFDAANTLINGVAFTWDIAGGSSVSIDPVTGLATADPTNTGVTMVRARANGDAITQGVFSIAVQTRALSQVAIGLSSSCPSQDCIEVTAGASYRVAANATLTFAISGKDQFGDPIAVGTPAWSSSDPSIVPAPTAGIVTVGGTPGSAVITASSGSLTSNAVALQVEARVPDLVAITGAPTNGSLTEGATAQLGTTVVDQFGATLSGQTVTWASDNSAVATVDANGLLTALTAGSANVTATVGTITATLALTVQPQPKLTTIQVTPAMAGAQAGKTVTFTAAASDQFGQPMQGIVFAWTSSDPTIATIDANGVATGVAPGAVTITAVAGGKMGTAALTITAAAQVVTTITVTPPTSSIVVGDEQQFTATARDQNGVVISTGVSIAWSSTDTTVATVHGITGLATGVAPGTTTIKASANGVEGTATLTVNARPAPVATIEVTPATSTTTIGGTVTFTATAKDASGMTLPNVPFTWTSSQADIAEVSAEGVAQAKALGSATITAAAGGKTGTATLTVQPTEPQVAQIQVTPASASVEVGNGQQYEAHALDDTGAEITGIAFTWSSNNTEVAAISADGFATARASGQATITATGGGKDGTASLTVTAKTATGCSCATERSDTNGTGSGVLWTFALALVPILSRRRS